MKPPSGLNGGALGWCACLALLLAFARLAPPARAADQPAAPEAKRSAFTFSLLPKSFQRNPSLDFHVVTELTPEGSKLAPPTAAQPVYYIAQPGQFTQLGDNVSAGETPPDVGRLTRAMESALTSGGYLVASPDSPLPALAIVFNYGSFARFSMDAHDMRDDMMLADVRDAMTNAGAESADGPLLRPEDRSTGTLLTVVLSYRRERDELLRRASIVGGEKFSRNLAKALADEAKYRGGGGDTQSAFNSGLGASPFYLFMNANEDLLLRVEDSFNGCYFIIASAFDYTAMRQGKRVLLWRTKMTVNSAGISMSESLPPLALAAGPYLGREMTDAVTITRKINRGGNVKLGELQVIETDVRPSGTPTPAAEKPKDGPK